MSKIGKKGKIEIGGQPPGNRGKICNLWKSKLS